MVYPKKAILIQISKWLLIIVFISIVSINMLQIYPPYVDDAFIFLRYADNIVDGYGFVWNLGAAPVEGYTSFLYLIIITAIRFFGINSDSIIGWLGILFSTITLLLTWKIIEIIIPDKPLFCFLVVFAVGFSPSFIYWTTGGLDVTLYTTLVLASTLVYFMSHDRIIPIWVVGLLFSLVALSRPEGTILIILPMMFEAFHNYHEKRKMLRNLIFLITPFITIYTPYFLWRWGYFGYLFPNTYYDKTGAGTIQLRGGVLYLWESLVHSFGLSLVLCIVFLIFLPIIVFRKINYKVVYLSLSILIIWGVVIINGGDHFGEGRFIIPSIPFFLTLVALGFQSFYERNRLTIILGLLAIVLFAFNSIGDKEFQLIRKNIGNIYYSRIPELPIANSSRYEVYNNYVPGFIIMGKSLGKIASPNESIAVVPIGAIGYYSKIEVIDMLGVVDPIIAHEPFDPIYIASWRPGHDKGDGKYILSLHPDYIQLIDYLTSKPVAEPDNNMMQYKSVVEIWNSLDFHNEYEFFPYPIGNGWFYNLYRRIH